MAENKPRGWGAFDALARRVVAVPKEAVDARSAAQRKAKKRSKKKR